MFKKAHFFVVLAVLCLQSMVCKAESVSEAELRSLYDMLIELKWDESSSNSRLEIFNRVRDAVNNLDKNTEDLQKNYEDLKANEQSTANKTLTALTTAATGIGGMQLAQGLSEQKADKDAEQDMAAYIATMRCTYADGKQVKAGPDEIELPGGNDSEIMKYRAEYFALATDLKERKNALGMKPGIESEEILDKAQMGLYDDENVGITAGSYASLYRAQMLGSETDQAQIDDAKKTSKNRVIGGAVAVGVGVVGGIIGNMAINKDAQKNKSKEILSEREKIVSDLNDALQEAIDDCNAEIAKAKANIPAQEHYLQETVEDEGSGLAYDAYVTMVKGMTPIKDVSDIGRMDEIPVCK